MSRSGHSGAEPRECPPDAPMGIQSIGELVYELNSPLRWSGFIMVLYTWAHRVPKIPISHDIRSVTRHATVTLRLPLCASRCCSLVV